MSATTETSDLFDAHCHLDAAAGIAVLPGESGARGRLLCGVDPGDWDAVASVAAAWPGSIPAFGLHPWHAEAAAGWEDCLADRLAATPAAWLGEAGLDGFRENIAPPATQERVFAVQLRLAVRLDRPVNLHCVKAWDALLAALDADYLRGGCRDFIVHSFSGPHQYIKPLTERGAYFTLGPLFSRRDSRRHRQRAAVLPANRLLLESDAFLAPGRDAMPDLRHTLAWLAAARGMRLQDLAQQIDANARRLFTS